MFVVNTCLPLSDLTFVGDLPCNLKVEAIGLRHLLSYVQLGGRHRWSPQPSLTRSPSVTRNGLSARPAAKTWGTCMQDRGYASNMYQEWTRQWTATYNSQYSPVRGMYPHVYETNYHKVLGQPQTQVGFQKKSLTSSCKTKSPEWIPMVLISATCSIALQGSSSSQVAILLKLWPSII